MELKNIKLIIWDLDETFWSGTISEDKICLIDEHVNFVKATADIGIVNSICSKNDFNLVKNFLVQAGLWDYFVFPSINWNPKGQRVKNIIQTMGLRAENVLFVDDNVQNLEEAKYFCSELLTLLPQDLPKLILDAESAEKKDLQHKRLLQYKHLEEKEVARTEFSSNEDFLMSCDIKVDVYYNCENEIDRIYELLMRSNQLNYTKFRQDKSDLLDLIRDINVTKGYVRVSDKFGDYGIVGFFAVKENELIHYTFSCRTLGMKIEQYIYYMLGCPKLDVVGKVATELNNCDKPLWINQSQKKSSSSRIINITPPKTILFKGPCDMSQMYSFLNLKEGFVTEFTYTSDIGVLVEGHNHTSQIVTSLYSDLKRKSEIISDVDFFDSKMLTTALQTQKFDFVVLSMLPDGNLGVYKRIETGEEIALCEKKYSLVDSVNREKYINGEIFTSSISFTSELLDKFKEKYSFSDNSNAKLTINNLQKIWEYIDCETILILLLGSEHEFKKKCPESYYKRHIDHAIMNAKIVEWSKDKSNVILIPFDKYIKDDSDFIDTINHFVKRVYYDLACDLVRIFTDDNHTAEVKSKKVLLMESFRQKIQIFKKRLINVKLSKH